MVRRWAKPTETLLCYVRSLLCAFACLYIANLFFFLNFTSPHVTFLIYIIIIIIIVYVVAAAVVYKGAALPPSDLLC